MATKVNEEWSRLLDRLLMRPVPDDDELEASASDRIDKADTDNSAELHQSSLPNSVITSCVHIENLPPDTSSLILSHLHPCDLHNFSLASSKCSKMFSTESLWRSKFRDRWNCVVDSNVGEESCNGFWRRAYKAAHCNSHDLWVRHWNCVFPEDVTVSSGRTVIPTLPCRNSCGNLLDMSEEGGNDKESLREHEYSAAALDLCPTCRHHPMLNGYNSDVVRAVRNELEYAKQSSDIAEECDPVHRAEVVAAAHALLANKSDEEMNSLGVESTIARTIHYSTMYSVAKWCRNVRLGDDNPAAAKEDESSNCSSLLHRFHNQLTRKQPNNSTSQQSIQNRAIYAFEKASTYNRRINTNQYQSAGLNFLTDALFFNIHTSYQKERTASSKWRAKVGLNDADGWPKHPCTPMDNLRKDLNDDCFHSLTKLGTRFETAHHSWHIIRLTNPEYVRPITYRCYIQCPEAFTVFPSQGYLKAGETVHLFLGVRMRGSLLNEGFEAIDVERDEADPSFTKLYAENGHLPLVPFAVRYMFAPCLPCLPQDFTARPDNQSRSAFAPTNPQQPTKFQSTLDHLWDNVSAEADVRTIHISGHVNSNYSLDEFQNATLMPFELQRSNGFLGSSANTPLTTVMPNLKSRSPQLFSVIQNLDKELSQTYASDCHRTEKCCLQCKRDWGPQSEILGRAYILHRLEIERNALIRSQQHADLLKTLQAIPLMLKRSFLDDQSSHNIPSQDLLAKLSKIRQLLYIIQTGIIMQKRADKMVEIKERQLFLAYERYLNETYTDLQKCIRVIESKTGSSKDVTNRPWRSSGVYSNVRCSDHVLPDQQSSDDKLCKPEPDHLRHFGLMEYNLGGFNLGRQDDPNHEGFQTYLGSQPQMHTDMFHNNATKGFLSAMAMIGKPESLNGHGIYDRVEKPGGVIRCPSDPSDVFFRTLPQRKGFDLAQQASRLVKEWTLGKKCAMRKCHKNKLFGTGWSGINFEMNDRDPDGLSVVVFGLKDFVINFQTTLAHHISNIPLPGQGKLLLSSPPGEYQRGNDILSLYTLVQPYSNIIFPLQLEEPKGTQGVTSSGSVTQNQPPPNGIEQDLINFPELNIVWLIARHLGITVDDDRSRGAILVDRRILIAVQWFSNTIMVFSLLASLLSRKFRLVKSIPADFHFFGSPIQLSNNDMRFWTAEECGFAAVIVFGFYFVLGRLSERNISRSDDREMRDSIVDRPPKEAGVMYRVMWRLSQFTQQIWDNVCPLFLQMRIFMPTWNKKDQQEILQFITFNRSIDYREHRSSFDADNGRGRMPVGISRQLGFCSYSLGLSFALLSFSACSPHFVVNSLTVFCCSLSFGMSMSVESLENVRRTTSTGVLSMVKPRRLNTLVIGFILMGQLVGGSGGIIFLAEFVVTTVCLILGGAATITSRAVECWITFLCLASTAFWGFVFARLGLLDTIRKRRRGIPSALLCASLCLAVFMWVGVFTRVDWEALTPGDVVLIQAHQLMTMARERWHSWQNQG